MGAIEQKIFVAAVFLNIHLSLAAPPRGMMSSVFLLNVFLFLEAGFTVFLVAVLIAIRPYFRSQTFFYRWMWAWMAHAASLAFGVWSNGDDWATTPFKSFILFVSVILSMLFIPLLIAGAESFRNSGHDAKITRVGTIAALAATSALYILAMLFRGEPRLSFEIRTLPPEIAVSGALWYCSYVFFRSWRRTDSRGTLLALLSCGSYGVAQALYVLLIIQGGSLNAWWILIDTFCQAGIAIATLLLILERESVTASMVRRSQEDLAKAYEVLQFETSHDSSLRIWNRRAVLDLLSKELKRAKRSQTSVSVFLADLDFFKRVNDSHGHLVGDEVLREAAERMSSALRESDHVGRYGGEEFLAVLPNCTAEGAMEVAERVRHAIGDEPFANHIAMTVSIGVSQWQPGQDAHELLHQADVALYRAKHNGRDRVEVENAAPQSVPEVHGEMKSWDNERKHIRRSGLDLSLQVNTSHQGEPISVQGRIRDMSEGGMGAVIPYPLQINEPVTLVFCIEGRECTVFATVRHCKGLDYGLEFLSIEPSLREAIAVYVGKGFRAEVN